MFDPDDPFDLLEESILAAQVRGWPASGWHMSGDEEGYAAWIFEVSGDVERPLWTESELMPTPLMAAKECFARATQLEHRTPQDN